MLKYFEIESVEIACWVNNSDVDACKQNLVFIHGSGGNHSIWSHQYGRLHKKYNIAAVNLPGHGHSGGKGEKDVRDYCLWIKKLLAEFDWKRSVLVGHSLGAAIALQFAINYPEEIAGIVCIGCGMKMPVNPFFLEFLQTNPPEVPVEIIDLICKYSLAKKNRSKYSAPLRKSISQSKVDVLYGDLSACNELDITRETGKISVPALIICGAEDKMTPPDLSRALAAGIRKATLEIVEGAGHMVMLERPTEFNTSLDKFAALISAVVPR
ncbi:MAG: alpha/beta hydrolase [Deltaproteobacteria bacterium]|nr:alpha/beta hydrolase [Deltaproteobacteria bacterium]